MLTLCDRKHYGNDIHSFHVYVTWLTLSRSILLRIRSIMPLSFVVESIRGTILAITIVGNL